jgi:hypothetical protein
VFEFDAQWYYILRRTHQAEDDLPCTPAVITLVDLASDGERASGDEKLEVLFEVVGPQQEVANSTCLAARRGCPRVGFNQSTFTLATTFCVVRCSYCMSRSVPESVPTADIPGSDDRALGVRMVTCTVYSGPKVRRPKRC